MRLVIQSLTTGRFLCPSLDGGGADWVTSLRLVGPGVILDMEQIPQLFEDYCDFEDGAVLVDLDRLGAANDYTDGAKK